MRLLFFRHGDPDYAKDALTEKGKREASLLADTIKSFGIDEVYVSPLGRAKETADFSLEQLGLNAQTLEWLQEFPAHFDANISDDETRAAYKNELMTDPETGKYEKRIVWDIMPSYYSDHPEIFDREKWRESSVAKDSNVVSVYDSVTSSFGSFLKEHGYERSGNVFNVTAGNEKTIAFFCHFGITCVLLSWLWNISPFVTMQFLAMAPTSVTELVSEEREKGIAIFRTLKIGDITHLAMGHEEPSFSARFCEIFENEDQRH